MLLGAERGVWHNLDMLLTRSIQFQSCVSPQLYGTALVETGALLVAADRRADTGENKDTATHHTRRQAGFRGRLRHTFSSIPIIAQSSSQSSPNQPQAHHGQEGPPQAPRGQPGRHLALPGRARPQRAGALCVALALRCAGAGVGAAPAVLSVLMLGGGVGLMLAFCARERSCSALL